MSDTQDNVGLSIEVTNAELTTQEEGNVEQSIPILLAEASQ